MDGQPGRNDQEGQAERKPPMKAYPNLSKGSDALVHMLSLKKK
jgi:hypothetical protein